MHRRAFVRTAAGAAGIAAAGRTGWAEPVRSARDVSTSTPLTTGVFHTSRRFTRTRFGNIAHVERGSGPAALFIHGYPLNGFQWRGALERLAAHRRCLAPDLLGLGYTETPAEQSLAPTIQATMLVEWLDALGVDAVDVVANDSGGAIAQLLVAHHAGRVRSLLLTNCDVHENSPPAALGPVIAQARAGVLADEFLVPQLRDPARARASEGLGGLAYTSPANLTDDAITYYFAPLVGTPIRRAQFNRYAADFAPNPLLAIEPVLRRSTVPARMLWGTGDFLFDAAWADWLDRALPRSRGVRRIEGAKLFFPEEMPDVVAEEARLLWGV